MFKKIKKSAACEMRSIIGFLNARNMKLADIHHQICEVYGEHAMSDSMVRRWVRHFNEGRENLCDDPQSDRPSVVNEDLVCLVEEKNQENR
jgi:transposase